MPRLQHANTAVVLSAVKVLMKYAEYIDDKDFVKTLERKLAPPLGTYAVFFFALSPSSMFVHAWTLFDIKTFCVSCVSLSLMNLVEVGVNSSKFIAHGPREGGMSTRLSHSFNHTNAVTMMSAEPEVQYVALRNINLIVQRRPNILKHEMKVFFVKYNDPIYVKLEKLDIMIKLATEANISQVRACVCALCLWATLEWLVCALPCMNGNMWGA